MHRIGSGLGISVALLLGLATPLRAQAPCAGDCDGTTVVTVSEVLRCVGIALGSAPLAQCPACDADSDGAVAIADVIAAIRSVLDGCSPPPTPTASLTPPPTPTATPSAPPGTPPACGDGAVQTGEECDDGNTAGGDGCAMNCTAETRRLAAFDPDATFAVVQSEAVPISLTGLEGSQVLTTGSARPQDVFDDAGQLLARAGEMPVAIRRSDLRFEPVSIPGTVCACVRGIEAAEFGPGNVATGVISCPGGDLSEVDVAMTVDHNTNPGAAGNSGSANGLPDDPECDDCTEVGPLLSRSCACREGRDADCSENHRDACNSPRVLVRSGGPAQPGSAFLVLKIAIGLLTDAGSCANNPRRPDGACRFSDYGPDCQPCTDDDVALGIANLVVATTGHAEAAVVDVNNSAGTRIAADAECFLSPCLTTAEGQPFSCAALAADPQGGLNGGALAVCFPGMDTDPLSDTVTCTRLAAAP